MNDFKTLFLRQLSAHPAMEPRDVAKLCYQAARGAEHLLADPAAARRYFDEEYAALSPDGACPLFERISGRVSRINLAPWKAANLPPEWLFRMFLGTAALPKEDEGLERYLTAAGEVLAETGHPMAGDWERFLADYRAAGMPALHHSEGYRAAERPAYRIVREDYRRLLPLLTAAARCEARPCVIALDGRAAAGKSTLAALLSKVMGAAVIRMDDFFLPPELRTPERLAAPGGNVHYERFAAEVLPRLSAPGAFSYRRFDCGSMTLADERPVPDTAFRVVEGAYSTHPLFGGYADLTVFCDVSPAEQEARILRRNGAPMLRRFQEEWIPMEERYFAAFGTKEKADLTVFAEAD